VVLIVQGNRRSAGFTDEERKSFQQNFLGQGMIDTFRRQHEQVVAYTYWGYRTAARPKNQGISHRFSLGCFRDFGLFCDKMFWKIPSNISYNTHEA
jgi:hypothetical protein